MSNILPGKKYRMGKSSILAVTENLALQIRSRPLSSTRRALRPELGLLAQLRNVETRVGRS